MLGTAANSIVKIGLQADVGGFVKDFAAADTAAGKLGATLSGLTRLGGATVGALGQVADAAQKTARHFSYLGISGVTFFSGLAIMAAKVETPLHNVETLGGLIGNSFEETQKKILSLSTQFPQSAGTLAQGLYNIASSGFYGADAMRVLKASSLAASAGLTTTDNAATAITSVLNAYGLSANKAGDVSDALFQTVNLGVVTFEQLTGVIGESVGMAANAGVSYSQLGAAIATMTLSGLSAEEAGTSANRLLQGLIDPSESLTSALKALGYESGAQALKVDGLRTVMDRLREASGGNIATLLKWFPEIRAARGAMALMSAEGENYARVADGIENKQNRAGATQRAFNIQMQSTEASFKKFINSLQALGVGIGQYFLPAANAMMHFATGIVGALDAIPGPVKQAVAWIGMLGSALLAIGAGMIAWQLKSALMYTGLRLIGKGLQAVGPYAGNASTSLINFGARLEGVNGKFGIVRAAFGGLGELFGRAGEKVGSMGFAIRSAGENMGTTGIFFRAFGSTLEKVHTGATILQKTMGTLGSVISGAFSALPLAVTAFIAFQMSMQSAHAEAKKFVEGMTKGVDTKSPGSLFEYITKLNAEYDKTREKLNDNSFFSVVTKWGKNMGDLATNLFGQDPIKDSSWDMKFKGMEISKKGQELLTTLRNIQANGTEMFKTIHPETDMGGHLLGVDSKELAFIATAAKKFGVDLGGSFEKSAPARAALMVDMKKMLGYFDSQGVISGNVTDAMIANYQKMEKEAVKASKGASDAVTKSFDVFKAIDPEKGDIGGQVIKFYNDMLASASKFYDNLQQLQQRGASPEVIQKMLQAGPEAAGQVVQAAVDDTTNGVIAVLNKGEAAIQQFANRAAAYARISQMAINDPTDTKIKDLPTAMQIQNEIFAQGSTQTDEKVAAALGLDKATAKRIAGEFGITLNEELDPTKVFKGSELTPSNLLNPFSDKGVNEHNQAEALTALAQALVSFNGTDPSKAASVVQQLNKVLNDKEGSHEQNAKRFQDLQDLYAIINQLPSGQRSLAYKVINTEIAKQEMKKVLDTFSPDGKPWDPVVKQFLISIAGSQDAQDQVENLVRYLNMSPKTWSMLLQAVGTDEAIQKAQLVDAAIQVLHGKNLPVTVDNVQAAIDLGLAQQWIDDVKQNTPPEVKVDTSSTAGDLDYLQSRIDNLHGTTIGIGIMPSFNQTGSSTLTPTQQKALEEYLANRSADGNLFTPASKFADGGHDATMGKGHSIRMWNEPETGGEAYIPLARSKRRRSVALWAQTGQMLGMYADGGVTGMIQAPAGVGGRVTIVNAQTSLNFNGTVFGEAHLRSSVQDMIQAHERAQEIDLQRDRSGY